MATRKSARYSNGLAERLRWATPKLIAFVHSDPLTPTRLRLEPIIRARPIDRDITLDEDYFSDPRLSPLHRPVYVRKIRRGADYFYTSTWEASGEEVRRIWGEAGLLHADSDGRFIARIETRLNGGAMANLSATELGVRGELAFKLGAGERPQKAT